MPRAGGTSWRSSPSSPASACWPADIWHLKPGGAVLDVGCGQGVLARRLANSSYSRYVGIDLSGSAISVAQQQPPERSSFFAADCEDYSPTEQFDVIVFNEVLCCLHDPLRTVERYARSLEARRSSVGVDVHGRARQHDHTLAAQARLCDRR